MLQNNNLINIILLSIMVIIVIIWLIITIRTIKFEKRIENYVIVNDKDKDISIIGKLITIYNNLNLKVSNILKKIGLETLFKETTSFQMKEQISFLADKLIMATISFLIYLVICLLTTYKYDFIVAIIFILLGYIIPIIKDRLTVTYRNKRIEKDLLKAISLMNNSFQTGKSIIQVIEVVKNELDGPLAEEFEKIENDLLHGLSLESAFKRLKERVNLEDIDYITTSLMILNQTGGNIVSVFSTIEESFYTRKKLDLELKSTISSSKLVFKILVSLPLFLWLLIGIWNPTYFTVFFKTEIGCLLFLVIICLYFLYIAIIKGIMKVEKY